ncbi:hypothetical protein ABXS71_06185 [Bacillus infantis]|uniref:hypothetical protein n=1 Tax=Bacillus infantis TaxID=324767 RepID=UPI00344C74A7
MNYFFCYTKKVSDFLQERGFQYITVAQDPKSKKLFSLYAIDSEGKLQKALDEYKK